MATKKVKKKATAVIATKKLIIAEKPSVAKDIVKVLPGKFESTKNYFESEEYIVSFAIGHLVTICTPPEIDEKYKSWSLDVLPMLPEVFPLKSLPNTKSQLTALTKLIKRKDVAEIINGCDAGREGELIFRYILQFVGEKGYAKKKLSRLWLQSMTKESILDGLANLRTNEEMLGLADAAKCRSEADWLIGINGSRALTGFKSRFGGFRLTPCGRVQTPTLSIIFKREIEIKKFIPKDYWEIAGEFKFSQGEYEARWIDPGFKKDPENPHGKMDRLWDKKTAEQIITECEGKPAEVTEVQKPTTQACPMLYDLTSLQREANNRFGFSAKHTLDIIQSLYDRHKVVTYPRTDSKHLPENYLPLVNEVMSSFKGSEFGGVAQKVLAEKWIKPNKKIFNNAKISDHHAVIPTSTPPSSLSEAESKLYKMITQRFIAIFYPVARFLNTSRLSVIGEHTFKTDGKILEDAGWKIVYGVNKNSDEVMQEIPKDEKPLADKLNLKDEQTKHPPRYTESTLLSIMESAGKLVDDDELRDAMKERGLGTAATRAAIIEGLIKDKYIVRQAKELIPTAKAAELLEAILIMKIDELTSPEMTGEWEYRLEQISKNKITREEFMTGINDFTRGMVKKVKSFDEHAEGNKKVVFVDKGTGKTFVETITFYESEDGEIKIRKFLGGRFFSIEEVQILLTERKIGPLLGFVSKKSGKPFSAMVKLKPDHRVEFVFEDVNEDPPDFKTLEVVGKSPVDDTTVYVGEMSYVSESYYDKESKTGLKVNKVLLGAEISVSNMKRMLDGEKTELIKGMRSSKTKRLFDAFLSLSKVGKISFSFPPRKSFKKKPAKAEAD